MWKNAVQPDNSQMTI